MDKLDVLMLIGAYLRDCPDFIRREDVEALTDDGYIDEKTACALLLASACGLNIADQKTDAALFHEAFLPMVSLPNPDIYRSDPYYRNITMPTVREGEAKLCYQRIKPYEAFVCGELWEGKGGRVLPRIGFFSEEYLYPALTEGERLWMSVTPNEIETMKEPINRAAGRVLVYGLGMGYYAYMISRKPDVKRITVVEKSRDMIRLFTRYLLPQFPERAKLEIVEADALEFASSRARNYDTVFADIWHDAQDGLPLWRALKSRERFCLGARFDYWIEPTLTLYDQNGL